jgi:hypothetical protein
MIFAWHSGENALVMPSLDGKSVWAIRGRDLRQMGFKGDDESWRKVLPRFDAPAVQSASPAQVEQAARAAFARDAALRKARGAR